jgi:trehalose 6-phosphate phosphatase
MVPLFSDAGLRRLDDIVGPGLLCVFDFDGTLAPIVEEPQKASLPQDVLQRLSVLSKHVRLAILTGRSVTDIRPRLGFEPDYLIGNHGAEGMPGWHLKGDHYRQLSQSWKAILSRALQNESKFDPSVWIEDKAYSLTVHYRTAQEDEQVKERLKALFARELPNARVIAGKSIFNLVPPNAPH